MQKGFIQILIIIIVLLVLVGGGLYFFQSQQKDKPSPTPQYDTYNNYDNYKQSLRDKSLKIYSNQNLGFSFKYHKDLTVREDSEEEFNKRGNGDFRKNFKGYVAYEPGKLLGAVVVLEKDNDYDTNPFTVWVFNNDNNLTIEQWYQQYWYYPFVWGDFTPKGKIELAPKNEATISGQMGKSGVIDYQEGKPKFVYLSNNNKMYLFRIIGQGDQILPNFKFLNQEKADCKVTGCSGQICSDEDAITTCEWQEQYACYKTAKCERQADGECGWTKTDQLTKCLQGKGKSE